MATDIFGLIKQFLGDSEIDELSKVLGTDRETTSRSLDSVIPAMLGGMIDRSGTPEGRREIYRATENQDDSILDDLVGLLGSGQLSGLMKQGTSLLPSLLGSKLPIIIPVLARLTGLDRTMIGKLASFLGPFLLSVFSKHKNAEGLDERGLAGFLESQRESVGRAMPNEVQSELGYKINRPAPADKRQANHEEPSIPAWLLPAALAAVALAAVLYYANTDAESDTEVAREVAKPVISEDAEQAPTIVTLGRQASDVIGELNKTLASIGSRDDATERADKLRLHVAEFNQLDVNMLDASDKSRFVDDLDSSFDELNSSVQKALDIPGVSEIVVPILEPMMDTIDQLKS